MPRRKKRDPESCLPLTPSAFQILIGLADGEKHGYAILKTVLRETDGGLRLSISTLYSALRRLEADGLIVESNERPDPALDDERRRYFKITDFGRDVARAELRRFKETIALAKAKRLSPRGA